MARRLDHIIEQLRVPSPTNSMSARFRGRFEEIARYAHDSPLLETRSVSGKQRIAVAAQAGSALAPLVLDRAEWTEYVRKR